MDCQVPQMDGYEAALTIRLDEPGLPNPVIPIADMTVNAMNGDDKACFDAGMDDYMAKPIDVDILFEKLSKWVSCNNPQSVTDDTQMQEPEVLVDQALVDQRMIISGLSVAYLAGNIEHGAATMDQ
jgi:CheY-like chemotaxis protein